MGHAWYGHLDVKALMRIFCLSTFFIGLFMSVFSPASQAALEAHEVLADRQREERARRLGDTLRCPVCGGQSINDSDAGDAQTIRQQIRERLLSGETDESITQALIDHYGEGVLLTPRFSSQHAGLWLFPLILFASCLIVLMKRQKQHKQEKR